MNQGEWRDLLQTLDTATPPSSDALTDDQIDLVFRVALSGQVASTWGLLTQLLIKAGSPATDALATSKEDLGDAVDASSRSFAKAILVPYLADSSAALRQSGDPYVSNPLRKPRLTADGDLEELVQLLEQCNESPELAAPMLSAALYFLKNALAEVLDRGIRVQAQKGVLEPERWSAERFFVVSTAGPAAISALEPSVYPKGRSGVGTEAEIPWFAAFIESNSSATEGCYPVYLFDAVGEAVYLCLNLGTENRSLAEIQTEVALKKELLGERVEKFTDTPDLRSSQSGSSRPRKYEVGSVACIRYEDPVDLGQSQLADDLREMVELAQLTHEEVETIVDRVVRVGGVYVGNDGAVNLKVGLDAATWGWSKPYDEQQELEVGDLFLLAHGGGGRVTVDALIENTAKEVHLCRVTKARYEEQKPLWPDEDGERGYPHRIGIEVLGNVSDFDYGQLPIEVNELFQTSSTKQGRVFVTELDSADQLFSTFGVANVPNSPVVPQGSIEDVVAEFAAALKSAHVDYGKRHDEVVRRFVCSLTTKRFLILTGLSGSGKTRLAQAFGEWLGDEQHLVVPVRPDWTSPDYLLGYVNELAETSEDGRKAWAVPETLAFMLQAANDIDRPYLLILDEMNLAHVERYFADVLSGIESNKPILPNLVQEGTSWFASSDTQQLQLPKNLFVVGTVNVDETTYMFSPKVLDRANTIEFRVETDDLGGTSKGSESLAVGSQGLAARFLKDSCLEIAIDHKGVIAGRLKKLHELLSKSGREFGHRTFKEVLEFAHHYSAAGGVDNDSAFDVQVYQKVLPRLHGSKRDIGPVIEELLKFCGPPENSPDAGAALPLSWGKLVRMKERLERNHFVSFAE